MYRTAEYLRHQTTVTTPACIHVHCVSPLYVLKILQHARDPDSSKLVGTSINPLSLILTNRFRQARVSIPTQVLTASCERTTQWLCEEDHSLPLNLEQKLAVGSPVFPLLPLTCGSLMPEVQELAV